MSAIVLNLMFLITENFNSSKLFNVGKTKRV